jgi:hypothetical protein
MKHIASDTIDCTRQNKLDDSIFQYEMVLRHLKSHEQLTSTCPVPSSLSLSPSISSKQREKSLNNEPINTLNETEEKFLRQTSIPNRQTQSLSRNVGRTFSEFVMNDLFSSSSKRSSNERQRSTITHASAQTDSTKSIHNIKDQTNNSSEIVQPVELNEDNSVANEETKTVSNNLDTLLDNNEQQSSTISNSEQQSSVIPNSEQQSSMIPNSEINVAVRNSPVPSGQKVRKK